MITEVVEHVSVAKKRTAVISDFTKREIPKLHWSALRRITVTYADGATNTGTLLAVDGLPEEIDDLRAAIQEAFASVARKHRARLIDSK